MFSFSTRVICSAGGCRRLAPFRCNTLQHVATRCNTLQHAATQCNAFPTSAHCNILQHIHYYYSRRSTATTHLQPLQHHITLQHAVTHLLPLQHTCYHCNTPVTAATHLLPPATTVTHRCLSTCAWASCATAATATRCNTLRCNCIPLTTTGTHLLQLQQSNTATRTGVCGVVEQWYDIQLL